MERTATGRRAVIKSRQGVRYPTLEGLMVGDPKTLEPTPKDGQNDRRNFYARQYRDEGLPEEPDGHPMKPLEASWFPIPVS